MNKLPRNPYLVAEKARQMHHEVLCAALHGGMSYEDAMRAANDRYREWLNEAMWMIKSQKPAKFDVEVSISIGIVAPDKRARDIDNLIKPCLDVLVKALVIKDNNSKYVRKVSAQWIASGPPCVVLIQPYEDIGD